MSSQTTHAFSEKVALVADGSTPAGKAVALQLALCGAYVIVAHPLENSESSVIAELQELGTLAASAPYSGGGIEAAREIANRAAVLYGRLDLLVNILSTTAYTNLSSLSEDQFSVSLEKPLQSVFFTTKECLRLLDERPKPRIVNIFPAGDSEDGKKDLLLRSTGAALETFTVALSENLPSKFRVNGICVSDSHEDELNGEELDAELFRRKPGIDPDDVARAALFLLSPEAKAINGQILRIGG